MKVAETGGSGTSSSSLSPYAGGDLQNKQERSKQLILLVFLDLHFSSVLFSSRCGFFSSADGRSSGGSVGAVCLSCSRRLAGESWVSV
jgi:hypothetical protein